MTKRGKAIAHGGARRLRTAALAGAALAAATGAAAQNNLGPGGNEPQAPLKLRSNYFGYAASVSPRVGYSDNINLAPKGLEQDSAIFSNLFTGAAIYSAPRLTGIISGDLDLSYITRGSDFAVNQRIGAAATATVVDNLLYVDGGGSTSRQLLGENARFSNNINAARGQQVNVHNYSVSPYFYRQFANDAVGELRYRFSQVFVADRGADANPFAANLLNDSKSQEVTATYQSRTFFNRLQLIARAYGNRTTEDGSVLAPSFQYEQGSVQLGGEYALNTKFSLSGAVGYDEVDTNIDLVPGLFNDGELSGVFWRAGFTARPGRKSFIRAEYGNRYGDQFASGEITYNLTRGVAFSAGADRTFQTRAQGVSSQFTALQQSTLDFAESLREGETLAPRAVIAAANRFANTGVNAQSVGLGTFDSAYASLRGKWRRTEIQARANYEKADFGFRTVDTYGGELSLRRQVSRKLTAYGSAFYRRTQTDFDPATCQTSPFLFGFDATQPGFDPVAACADYALANGETDTIGGRVGAQYQIYENLSVFGEYVRTNRLAESPLLEYGENAVVAGVTLDF